MTRAPWRYAIQEWCGQHWHTNHYCRNEQDAKSEVAKLTRKVPSVGYRYRKYRGW